MPKRRSRHRHHAANTCHKAIRRECRAWGVKRRQFDAAVAFLRIEHGGMPSLVRAVQHASWLYFDEEKFEKRLHGSWVRGNKKSEHRVRSKGFVVRKLSGGLYSMPANVYRKVKRRRK